jgi:transcription-repair coupling factor (superfamily II helicase)
VGRGAALAYAYFLFERGKKLTPVAEKRLRTIYEATELGAGFSIAMRDLEIRGAGNLLGVRQSGHISAVGFNLYSQMLAAAVENMKAQKAGLPARQEKKLPPPGIDLPIPALIPEDYVSDVITRLSLYQRLADMADEKETGQFREELNDRFGPPPLEADNLLFIIGIRALGTKAGIESISAEGEDVVLRLFEGMRVDQTKLGQVPRAGISVGENQVRIAMKQPGKGWQKALVDVLTSLGTRPPLR